MSGMSGITVPALDWDAADLPTAFRRFRNYVNHVFGGPLADQTKEAKASYLMLWLGPVGIELLETFNLSAEMKKDVGCILDRFETHCAPKTNFRLARYNFLKLKQHESESYDNFIARLRIQADKCKFGESKCERILEQLIAGATHEKVQEKLLAKDEKFTLDQAIDVCRTFEANKAHLAEFTSDTPRSGVVHTSKVTRQQPQPLSGCSYCGRTHGFGRSRCPARNSKCSFCGRIGHWVVVCRGKLHQHREQHISPAQSQPSSRASRDATYKPLPLRAIHEAQFADVTTPSVTDTSEEEDRLVFHSVNIYSSTTARVRKDAFVDVLVSIPGQPRNHVLHAKIDTGADGNILPLRCFNMLPPGLLLRKENVRITAYNNYPIPHHGSVTLKTQHGSVSCEAIFYVVETDGPIILGLPTCEQLRVITIHTHSVHMNPDGHAATAAMLVNNSLPVKSTKHLHSLYPDCFEGLGRFSGTAHIELDPDTRPVVHPPRKCPIHLREALEKELDRMQKLGVIEKMDDPTEWVSSLVVARKPNGSLRVCLDPKDLNNATKRPHHRLITPEEVTHQLSGSTVFTKLDAMSGYWCVVLDDESSRATTFNTPFGRYRFLRMPFGWCGAQDVFQKKMDEILNGLSGVMSIADDICVHGKDRTEHDQRLHQFMQRARERGLVLNLSKCHVGLAEVTFFGHSFSDLTHRLRQLLKEDVSFEWLPEYQSDFETLKGAISSETTLAHYRPDLPVSVEVDASSFAIGAVLQQEGRPVCYASKSLTDTEQRYANIEREMLAVVFGCERFRTYLYGRSFTVITDHKPLEMVTRKPLNSTPARLQRMLLRLMEYDVTVQYRPGRMMLASDALSRLPADRGIPVPMDMDVRVDLVHFSPERLEKLRRATASDEELSLVRRTILDGWPDRRCQLNPQIRNYWSVRDSLVIDDGIILKETQPSYQNLYVRGISKDSMMVTKGA
ncbi:uncharacterized protein LOC123499883 [Portunus trituberculatus]|uniref:uncharacterized protein LOC123499883 n=1 Tax=Portunus trituberculatus TaxID=210409 RepID=UPI001E1D03F4|nr:uncharacterized protein LOC123499883 [Portunus trituberculatus]